MCMSHYFIAFGSAHLQSALAPSDNECSHRPMCFVHMHAAPHGSLFIHTGAALSSRKI